MRWYDARWAASRFWGKFKRSRAPYISGLNLDIFNFSPWGGGILVRYSNRSVFHKITIFWFSCIVYKGKFLVHPFDQNLLPFFHFMNNWIIALKLKWNVPQKNCCFNVSNFREHFLYRMEGSHLKERNVVCFFLSNPPSLLNVYRHAKNTETRYTTSSTRSWYDNEKYEMLIY